MKLVILSRSPRCYSTRRLKEAAAKRGHKPRVMDTLHFGLFIESNQPALTYHGKPFHDADAIIPRIGASITFYGCAVVRQFEQMGVFSLSPSGAIAVSRDKLRALQVLSRHNIGMPATAFVRRKEDVMPAIARVGGAPVIIKLLEGTQGIGVILADSPKIAEAIIETLQSTKQNVLIQKFVAESKGRDIRALVVGDRVVAAMRRRATGSEFRSNVHRGGAIEKVELDEVYERTAVRAAHMMGLRVAGVDMLEGADGPQIMEVNSSPGLEGIEAATKQDIAGAIIEHVEEQARFGDLDLRQRLTLSKGYVVSEVPLPPGSDLVNKTLKETGLRERDIVVLSILRGGESIANPRSERELLAGDTLLCFGKQVSLSSMVPTIRPRPRPRRGRGGRGKAGAAKP